MIIDSHAYCFTAPDQSSGHASGAAHLEFWQRAYGGHHQPAIRLRDRATGDARVLLDPRGGNPPALTSQHNFRVDPATRRLVWTVDGEDYTKYYHAPNTLDYPAGALVSEMDYAGVDWALLHADHTLERDVRFTADCVRAFPDRLRAMVPIDEWLIPTDPDAAIRQAFAGIREHGLHSLKIIPAYAYMFAGETHFDGPKWRPFWDAVATLKVPIYFTLGSSPGVADPRQGFIEELSRLRRWLDRYPGMVAGVTHGYPWRAFIEGDRFVLPEAMWAPFKDSSLAMEVCFPIRVGDRFDYPYAECRPVIAAMVEKIGPDRLFWGTDMPFQNRFCTYRQSRTYIENYCSDFLSAAALDQIMCGTAARMLKIPTP